MAVVLEKQDLRVYEIRKKKHRRRVAVITAVSIIAFIIMVITIIFMVLNRQFNNYEVINSIERKDTASATYYPYKDGVLRLSRDGIMAMDGSGVQLFNGMFQMQDPVMDACGNYVVAYDRGGKSLEIMGSNGKMTEVNIPKPIVKAEVANQGVVAVLMDGGDESYIHYYTAEGKLILETRTLVDSDGYPIDIALSEDGIKLVTSYVAINNGNMQSKVTFQNFSNLGGNYTANIVGGKDLGQTLVGDVEFINNNIVCAFGDDRFVIYTMEKVPGVVHEEVLTKEIKNIFYSKEHIGLVLLNNGGESKYEIVVYDLKGNKVFTKNTNMEYDKIHISGNEIIIYTGSEWYIYTMDGKQKFYYKFNEEITDVFPGKGMYKYIIVKSNSIEDVKLTDK